MYFFIFVIILFLNMKLTSVSNFCTTVYNIYALVKRAWDNFYF